MMKERASISTSKDEVISPRKMLEATGNRINQHWQGSHSEIQKEALEREMAFAKADWEELISDLHDLKEIACIEKNVPSSRPGHVEAFNVLVTAGRIPKEALSQHPIYLGSSLQMALSRIARLRALDERLTFIETASRVSVNNRKQIQGDRMAQIFRLEKEWGIE
jgi:hypothetical protein